MATTNIGKTKRSTDDMINEAIDRQQSWMTTRRIFTREFLKRFNVFKKPEKKQKTPEKTEKQKENYSVLRAYWLPILCALLVILIALFVMLFKINTPVKVIAPSVPEPVVRTVKDRPVKKVYTTPSFDLVRIEKSGNIIIAGRNVRESNISIMINKKIVATEHTNADGEFVYAPSDALTPGNYLIRLIDSDKNIKSEDSVFVYVSDNGYQHSISLLMTKNGSKIMQGPETVDGDLFVSKIDYLDTGRIVVTGKGLPRLRVSLTLNDKYLGFARVSDYKNFALGADAGELKSGENYKLNIRLHDAEGTAIANVVYEFVMPEMTGDDNTFYTVRRGDCLWIIARNFLRRGVLFTMIAERNAIKNPDLIFPEQVLQIPTKD